MDRRKRIALSAHDAMKPALAAWAFANEAALAPHALTATGNMARRLASETALRATPLHASALGGDMQLGALMADGQLDIVLFFIDPLSAKPFDIDPAPLIRMATLSQTALALNEASADFIVRSELLAHPYHRPQSVDDLPPVPQRLRDRRHTA